MSNGQPPIGANLSFTKFLFIVADQDDAATLGRIRTAGSNISRGFFNDYDADGSRDVQPQETIQFLVADGAPHGREGIGAAKYVVQLSANYRPRLEEVACDLKRRVGGIAEVIVLDGAERAPRYTSAELHNFAYKQALAAQQPSQPASQQAQPRQQLINPAPTMTYETAGPNHIEVDQFDGFGPMGTASLGD